MRAGLTVARRARARLGSFARRIGAPTATPDVFANRRGDVADNPQGPTFSFE
jgi:hypothetical protein